MKKLSKNIVMLGRIRIFVVGQYWLCVLGSLMASGGLRAQ